MATANRASAFAPLAHPVFRRLWWANAVSTLGFWIQQVAAAWLMTQLTDSAALVALLAAAAALPTFLLALPAGALADVVDRRRMIIATQGWQAVVALALGLLTLAGSATPALLLAGSALYGVGAALGGPPAQAVLPELVAAEELPQAISLNATSFTAAQAIGPAIGGVLVATAGAGWAFVANAASFAGALVVYATWRRERHLGTMPAEHVLAAVRTGVRFVRNDPPFRIVLGRLALHVVGYSAIPALLVIAVREDLGSGAGGYGIALGAFGTGGVIGALVVQPRLAGRAGPDRVALLATVVLSAGTLAGVALAPSLAWALPGLLFGGAASLLLMTALQSAAQDVLPDWVRGRGLAVVQLVFQLSIAAGSLGWGALASATSVGTSFLVAAVTTPGLLALALVVGLRLTRVTEVDVSAAAWPGAPGPAPGAVPADGPVVVTVEYRVAREDTERFLGAMRGVAQARRRDGAFRWALATDLQDAERHLETYLLASGLELERHRARLTADDAALIDAAVANHRGDGPPVVRHLLGHHQGARRPHGARP